MISPLQKSNYKMPALFIGHGSPMNAIEENEFTRTLLKVGGELMRPQAVLVISMIYDMYGFPNELYQVQYPAPGSPEFAKEVQQLIRNVDIQTDYEWGFDHGNWSILKWLFPNADVPVFQMSIDYYRPMEYHHKLAQELKSLREKGVLIIGSGNLTHNLRMVHFENQG